MVQEEIIEKNTEVLLKSIASNNKEMHQKIKKQYPTLTSLQIFIILLTKLSYSINEIVIILGTSPKLITESIELISQKNQRIIT